MAPNSSAVKENDRSHRRWVWLLLLLALLMSFACVFCSTWWAFWWPDRLTPASLLAHRQADYRRSAADELNFGLLDPLVVAQAASDIARLQMTPAGAADASSIPSLIIGLLPATPTPTAQPEIRPLPQATNTPGNDTTPPTTIPSPPATDIPPAMATASVPPPTATAPVETPTPLIVPTSTPVPSNTPVVASPTPLPTPSATSVPPTLPPPPPTSPPKPKPTATPTDTPMPTFTPTSTATPTSTDTPTATPTDTATPTNTPIPGGTVLALCGTGITIDGNLNEPAWSGPATSVSNVVLGSTASVTVTYRVLWDATSVYIGVDVVDATPVADSSPIYWDDDAAEIFFDIDYNDDAAPVYNADDFQFVVSWGDPLNYYLKHPVDNYYSNGTTGVQFNFSPTAAGYSMEMVIPWSVLGTTPGPGNVYGFDLGADDDQDGGNRETQLMWYGTANNWQDTSAFGNLLLDNCIP